MYMSPQRMRPVPKNGAACADRCSDHGYMSRCTCRHNECDRYLKTERRVRIAVAITDTCRECRHNECDRYEPRIRIATAITDKSVINHD